ncbi:MAG: SagB/ThcOx family dehydrogenase, partial [Deltaproteobacteria bacterium]|nr:SagB/ThcOx family dehydrogenase [Deltaproteobacteria bacterium]
MASYKQGIAFRYIQDTKYHRDRPMKDDLGSIPATSHFKNYPDAARVQLSQPELSRPADLWQCLARRRSERNYSSDPLGLDDFIRLLWAAQGVTARAGSHLLRTAPSAGALYPFETYLYVDRVEDIPQGLYHLNVADFVLERLKDGNYNRDITAACLGQPVVRRAAVVFIWTAMMLR